MQDGAEKSFLTRAWNDCPGNLKGSLWLVIASLLFAGMTAAIKDVGQRIPVWEILFVRQICVIAILSPTLVRTFPSAFHTQRLPLHGARIICSVLAMVTGFTAVIYMPLAQVTAISFARTLFITILAILILKEVVDTRRWGATLLGFVGVLIVVQPSLEGIDFYALLAIISAVFVAFIMVLTRMMTSTESPVTIMTYQSFGLALAFAVPTYIYWETPTLAETVLMIMTGIVMSVAQYANIQAYKNGEASAIQPMEYTRLVFAGLIGVFLFQEYPSVWTIVGSVLIFCGAIYSVRGFQKHNGTVPPAT